MREERGLSKGRNQLCVGKVLSDVVVKEYNPVLPSPKV